MKVLDVLSENLLLPPKRSFPLRFRLGALGVDHSDVLQYNSPKGGGKGGREATIKKMVWCPLSPVNSFRAQHYFSFFHRMCVCRAGRIQYER